MRVIAIILMLSSLVPFAVSQASEDLRAKYGKPIGESFMVQPKIAVTATYSLAGPACQINIHPMYPVSADTDDSHAMPTDVVSALIETFAPSNARGALLNQNATTRQCTTASVFDYPTVTISRWQHDCGPAMSDRDIIVLIRFKERECAVNTLRR
jgi:hypothetical protein